MPCASTRRIACRDNLHAAWLATLADGAFLRGPHFSAVGDLARLAGRRRPQRHAPRGHLGFYVAGFACRETRRGAIRRAWQFTRVPRRHCRRGWAWDFLVSRDLDSWGGALPTERASRVRRI